MFRIGYYISRVEGTLLQRQKEKFPSFFPPYILLKAMVRHTFYYGKAARPGLLLGWRQSWAELHAMYQGSGSNPYPYSAIGRPGLSIYGKYGELISHLEFQMDIRVNIFL